MPKQAKVKPTYLKGKKPITIGLHDVVKALKMIDDRKLTKKFATAAKRKKAFMSVPPDTVNFVKDFVAKNKMHDHPIGKHIVNAREKTGVRSFAPKGMTAAAPKGDRFDCNFGS